MIVFLINGSIGVGKSTIGSILSQKISNSCWIEADAFMYNNPFNPSIEDYIFVAKEIKRIAYYHKNKGANYVFVSWCVFDKEIKQLIDALFVDDVLFYILLVVPNQITKKRIQKDISENARPSDNLRKIGKGVYDSDHRRFENIDAEQTVSKIIEAYNLL